MTAKSPQIFPAFTYTVLTWNTFFLAHAIWFPSHKFCAILSILLQAKSFRTSFLVQTSSVCLHPTQSMALPRLQPLLHTFSLPSQHLPDPLSNPSPILPLQILGPVFAFCILICLSESNPINRVLALSKTSYFPKFFFPLPVTPPPSLSKE